jgi:hypothetical protein
MKNQRARKALYVNRREELYPEALLSKERSPGKTSKGLTRKTTPPVSRKAKPER